MHAESADERSATGSRFHSRAPGLEAQLALCSRGMAYVGRIARLSYSSVHMVCLQGAYRISGQSPDNLICPRCTGSSVSRPESTVEHFALEN